MAPAGGVDLGEATQLLNFATAAIRYRHASSTFLAGTGNAVELVNIRASQGADTINVNATTATTTTNLNAYLGSDTVTINGDNLSANNVILGHDGNDQFNLNITANLGAGHVLPAHQLADRREQRSRRDASDSSNRDRVNLADATGGRA